MPQCYPGSDLVLLAASIAVALSEGLSADDINILSAFIVAIGDNLAIIAVQKQYSKAPAFSRVLGASLAIKKIVTAARIAPINQRGQIVSARVSSIMVR